MSDDLSAELATAQDAAKGWQERWNDAVTERDILSLEVDDLRTTARYGKGLLPKEDDQ